MKIVFGKKAKEETEDKARTPSYVVKSMIKKYAANRNKRVSPSYMAWINRRIIEIMDFQISALGGKVTLNGHDAEMITKLRR